MLRETSTTAFNKSLAFALGFSFAFLPSYGPFAGLLLLFASRLALRRTDLIWAGAALSLALPLAAQDGLRGLLFGLAQIGAPWLIYKTFSRLPASEVGDSRLLELGLVSGLAAIVALGLLPPSDGPLAGVTVWNAAPALFAHTMLALGLLLAIMLQSAWLRLACLGFSAVGIAAAGSREAGIAWLVVAAVLALAAQRRHWPLRLARLALLGAMLALLAGVVPGWSGQRTPAAAAGPGAGAAAQLEQDTPRLPYWRAAWQGFVEKPVLGWGRGRFEAYFASAPRENAGLAAPAHAHNIYLQMLFERGALGFAGLLLLVAALGQRAARERDWAFLIAFLALLGANFFDTTLLYGGVIYPLAAVAGWRAASYRAETAEQESALRQLAVRFSLALADFCAAAVALVLASLLRHAAAGIFGLSVPPPTLDLLGTVGYALLLWPAMAWREGLYPGYGLSAPQELKKEVLAAGYAGLILVAGTLLFYKELPVSRSILALAIVLSMVLGPLGRALTKRLLDALGLWGRRVVVLGAGEAGQRLAEALLRRPLDGLEPVGFFAEDPGLVGQSRAGLPVLGSLANAGGYAERHNVHHAIAALQGSSHEGLAALIGREGRAFRQVQFVPEIAGLPVYGVSASSLADLLALEVRNELNFTHNRILKRALDLFGVTVGGILISPLILALALAVALDSRGPVFFGHRRLGRGGRHFECWKFRTMAPDAQDRLDATLAANPELRREWDENHKLQDDPRVTRVGRFLRRTSLDELPQLWNVLVGEMSLVGPRPIVDEEIEKYGDDYELYKMVRPGMAGYWQVRGRSDTDYQQRVELDSFYVRNWSVWLDLTILSEVPGIVMEGRGAY